MLTLLPRKYNLGLRHRPGLLTPVDPGEPEAQSAACGVAGVAHEAPAGPDPTRR